MSGCRIVFVKYLVLIGGVFLPSFFVGGILHADSILLKNEKELKGLVVEKHADRIILSTEKGEIPILLTGIKDIQYDAPEQNFFKAGKSYEGENKLGQALAYYEKALEVNSNFEEAKMAALAVRNRFWANSTEGPRGEIEKQQAVYDAWEKGGGSAEEAIKKKEKEQAELLKERLGITLKKRGDWAFIENLDSAKAAFLAGLRRNDRLVSADGESLRYLNLEVIRKVLLVPRFSNFNLEFDRDCFLKKEKASARLNDLGLKLTLQHQGLIVQPTEEGSAAQTAGIRSQDLLTHVNGVATRYMPLKDVVRLIEDSNQEKISFTVRRSALLARG